MHGLKPIPPGLVLSVASLIIHIAKKFAGHLWGQCTLSSPTPASRSDIVLHQSSPAILLT